MKNSWWFTAFLVILFSGAAFVTGSLWAHTAQGGPESASCLPDNLPAAYALLNSRLREFDDAATLAINVPREQVVTRVEDMQRIRRQTEELDVPNCLVLLRASMLAYMNRVVELLVGFAGGVSPALVLQGLESSEPLRDAMEAEMATLTGATVTPFPTPFQFASLADPTATLYPASQPTS
ncbi:MAG: hypothetical protein WEA61_01975, partial [Anaerolineales bacterium]